MTGFLPMTRKSVSTSSGILLKIKSMTQKPTAPWPKEGSAGAHTESQAPFFHALYSRCGAVRAKPAAEKTASSRFHTASWFLHCMAGREAISQGPTHSDSTRYRAHRATGTLPLAAAQSTKCREEKDSSKSLYRGRSSGRSCGSWRKGQPFVT